MTKVVVTTISVFCGAVLLLAACSASRGFDYSGTLQAESALVGSTIGGRITSVNVSDGQRVRKGDSIVAFDASTQRAALAAAQSQVAQAAAALADLQAGARPQ
jgi:HlyD family secretion protein